MLRVVEWTATGVGCLLLTAVAFFLLLAKTTAGQTVATGAIVGHGCSIKPCSPILFSGTAAETIEIPELGVTAPITSGIGKIDLIRGVGRIPGSAAPGGLGTMALAGHRDTFFRSLQRVKPTMKVFVHASSGRFEYEVDSTTVVNPGQVDVLDIVDTPQLVLITCFPFDYIGSAPQRFIVRAHLVSALPTS